MATSKREPTLSIGRLVTLWLVCKHSDGKTKLPVARARAERELNAAVPLVKEASDLSLILGLTVQDEDCLRRTRYADETFNWDTEFPSSTEYRLLLLRYVERVRPLWALNATLPRSVFAATTEPALIDCLEAAKVLGPGQEPEWWDAINTMIKDWERKDLAAIGKQAEELTIDFERQRLNACGLVELARRVRWMSQESDAYGYDVLSFCGDSAPLFGARTDDPLRIEVKGTVLVTASARFFLTRHEWTVACSSKSIPYCFYIWHLPRTRAIPLIRKVDSIRPYLPSDSSQSGCQWTECRVMVPSDL